MLTEYALKLEESWSLNCARGPAHGPPVLFLHGVLRCWQDFLPLIPSLSLRWQVHALDFRGHGRSAPRTFHYRVRDYVEDAEAFLLHACPAPAVVCGHSLGAMVALAAAAGPAADRCRALLLEDPPFGTPEGDVEGRYTGPYNLAGNPAVSLPCGLAEGNLPAGLQLAAAFGNDELLLSAARVYEEVAP